MPEARKRDITMAVQLVSTLVMFATVLCLAWALIESSRRWAAWARIHDAQRARSVSESQLPPRRGVVVEHMEPRAVGWTGRPLRLVGSAGGAWTVARVLCEDGVLREAMLPGHAAAVGDSVDVPADALLFSIVTQVYQGQREPQ